jgi:hypothetical protein
LFTDNLLYFFIDLFQLFSNGHSNPPPEEW